MEKAYITRFVLDVLKPEKFQIHQRTTATIDAHGYVNSDIQSRMLLCISAWGLGCSFWWIGQSQGLSTWSGQRTGLHAFLYIGVKKYNHSLI